MYIYEFAIERKKLYVIVTNPKTLLSHLKNGKLGVLTMKTPRKRISLENARKLHPEFLNEGMDSIDNGRSETFILGRPVASTPIGTTAYVA